MASSLSLIVDEFLATERDYLRDVEALSGLCKAIPKLGAADGQSTAAIFLNVPDILECNRSFLKLAMSATPSAKQIALAFTANTDELIRAYKPYVGQHYGALDALESFRGDRNFEAVVDAFLKTLGR